MRLSADARTVRHERHGGERDTAAGAWKKCWWQEGRMWSRSASEMSYHSSNTESLYGR